MDELEKVIYINKLLSLYSPLLSLTQQEILSDYYNYNLSISEIASERNISRSAVEDALKKGVTKLKEIEEKLSFLKKSEDIKSLLEEIKKKKHDDISHLLDEIERRL